jgi:hypothetical protein
VDHLPLNTANHSKQVSTASLSNKDSTGSHSKVNMVSNLASTDSLSSRVSMASRKDSTVSHKDSMASLTSNSTGSHNKGNTDSLNKDNTVNPRSLVSRVIRTGSEREMLWYLEAILTRCSYCFQEDVLCLPLLWADLPLPADLELSKS